MQGHDVVSLLNKLPKRVILVDSVEAFVNAVAAVVIVG